MKNLSVVMCIIFLFGGMNLSVYAQSDKPQDAKNQSSPDVISMGLAIYWKTMSPEEKNTFLTGYLMSHYEVLGEIVNSLDSGNESIENLKSDLEQTVAYFKINSYDERGRFIELIDQYYKRKIHSSSSFAEALQYAYRILQYEKSHAVQAQ